MNFDEYIQAWQANMRINNINLVTRAFTDSRKFATYTHNMCRMDQVRLAYLANRAADYFWSHNRAHRTDLTDGYPGHYGCRVRLSAPKFELSWYYNQFKRKNDGSGKHNVISHYLPKEGEHGYFNNRFNRAHDWELPIILGTEQAFRLCRRVNQNLTIIRRKTSMNLRLLGSLECLLSGLEGANNE
jgi:hypothetical protein